MTASTLPMFPLGSVLLPGEVLPLHVFEPRYRALVRHCLAADVPEFGVVLIERGSEVGGGDVRRTVGTVARVLHVEGAPDGRYAVVAAGTRRIRVVQWLPDQPYPAALVEDWPDVDDGETPALAPSIDAVLRHIRKVVAMASELGDPVQPPDREVPLDPVDATYQLVGMAPLGPADRYDLLAEAGPAARLARLATALDDLEALLHFRMQAG